MLVIALSEDLTHDISELAMADLAKEKAIDGDVPPGADAQEDVDLQHLGYKPELIRTRSLYTILFQSLAIAAVPFGEGTALLSAIIGGGQLAYFLGWIVVCILDECVAMSLAELASRFPTAAGPYYWSCMLPHSVILRVVYALERSANSYLLDQMANERSRVVLSFITGWTWLVGNWTICLSVNFGTASLLAGTVTMCMFETTGAIWHSEVLFADLRPDHPDWYASPWQLLLIFYALCTYAD